jgi:hypothetical protein
MGTNVLVSNWAYATPPAGGSIAFIWSPQRAFWFPSAGGAALYGAHYTMAISGSNYVVTDYDSGTVYIFDSVSGLLSSVTTPGGQVTANTIVSPAGGVYRISQTSRSFSYTQCGTTLTTNEALSYSYYPIDGSTTSGLLQYVILSRTDAATVQIRQLAVSYYGNNDPSGMPGI